MKIKKWLLLFLFLVFTFNTTIINAETEVINNVNTWSLETIEEKEKKLLEDLNYKDWTLEYLEEKKDRIKEKLWIDQNTTIEKNINDTNWKIIETKLEAEILEKIKDKNILEIENLEKELKNKHLEINKLKKLLKNNNNSEKKRLNIKIWKLKKYIDWLENAIEENKIQKKIASVRIQELILQAWELQIYKNKYEKEYKKEIEESKNIIYKNIWYYLIYILFFVIIHLILKAYKNKYEKEGKFEKLNKISIAIIFLYIILIFWTLTYLVVLKPAIALIFILIGSWILMSIKLVLSSFFASFWTSFNYTLWEIIEIWTVIWKIKEKKLLSLILSEMDENYNFTWNTLKIPNYQLLENNVKKIKNHNVKEEELIINIDINTIDWWLNSIIKEVDNILYKKEFEICDIKNKKRYFLEINLKKINEFELIFKYKKKKGEEVNLEIMNKIISLKIKEEKQIKN